MNLLGPGQALDDSVPTILSEFKAILEDLGVMRGSSTPRQMRPNTGNNYNVINYNRLQGYHVNLGVPATHSQELADTLTPMTPGEVVVKIDVPGSTLRRNANPNLPAEIAYEMAKAYNRLEEQDGATQLSLYTTVLSTAGTAFSPGYAHAMVSRLGYGANRATPEAPPRPWNFIVHPIHSAILGGRLVPLADVPAGTNVYTGASTTGQTVGPGRTEFGDMILNRGVGAIGTWEGTVYKETPYIPVNSSDDSYVAVFAQDGLYYINEVPFQVDPTPLERDGRQLVGWGSYCFAGYHVGNYGIAGIFDTTELTA